MLDEVLLPSVPKDNPLKRSSTSRLREVAIAWGGTWTSRSRRRASDEAWRGCVRPPLTSNIERQLFGVQVAASNRRDGVGTASSRLSDAVVHTRSRHGRVGCHPRATTVVELGFLDVVGERQVLRWTCRSPRRPPKSAVGSRRHSVGLGRTTAASQETIAWQRCRTAHGRFRVPTSGSFLAVQC